MTTTDVLPAAAELVTDADHIRVLLVDARPERRSVMRAVLENSSTGAVVVAEADGEADAVVLVDRHRADLAIIDFQPPVAAGLGTVGALRRCFPGLVIVVASFDRVPTTRTRALEEGANVYLLKPVSAREVMAAVRDAPNRSRAGGPAPASSPDDELLPSATADSS